jgi:aminoglycoside phosphotransferase
MQRDRNHIKARMGALGSELRELHDIRMSDFPPDGQEVF